MRKLLAIAAVTAITIISPLAAQQTPPPIPGSSDASLVTAGTYSADASHTLIGFRVNHFGFNDYFGVFGDATGTLTLDPANPAAAQVSMTIPISGLSVASDQLATHMASGDFFDVAQFPEARFVSTSVTVDGTEAMIVGDLTIRGVTRSVALAAEFTGVGTNPFNKKETVGFEATTTIKRSEFGMTYGIPLVSDEVDLDISAAFEKN